MLLGLVLRSLTNFLDVLALAGIGLLGLFISTLGQISQGEGIVSSAIPWLRLDATSAVLIAGAVGALFLTKSAFSAFLGLRLGETIANIQSRFAREIIVNKFNSRHQASDNPTIEGNFQNVVMVSLRGLVTELLTAYVTLVSEATLIVLMMTVFLIVNPLAALGTASFLALVLYIMNLYVTQRIRVATFDGYTAADNSMDLLRDFHSIRNETEIWSLKDIWVDRIVKAYSRYSGTSSRLYFFSSLPRYVIESALIVGVIVFLGAAVVFSDLPTQAVTIGVFLTGGLRLVASAVPLQNALTLYRQSCHLGRAAHVAMSKRIGADHPKREIPKREGNAIEVSEVGVLGHDTEFILNSVTFDVPIGAKFAIVGPSGAGKTTLLETILGLRAPDKGRVRVSIADSDSDSERAIGYVPQRPELIQGTLRDNITLLDDSINDDSILESLERAGLTQWYNSLENGLETRLGPQGRIVSGGELQRIGLTRALSRNSRIIVLDEATSALDATTEYQISNSLDRLRGEVTLVIVAHRVSTIKNADCIIFLSKGQIRGSGTYDELADTVKEFSEVVRLLSTDSEIP